MQLKVAFLLKNIIFFSEHYNIIIQDQHKLWSDENFELPSEHKLIDIVLNNQIKHMKKLKIMSNLQKEVIMSLKIGEIDNSMTIDDITDYTTDDNNNNNNNNESDIDFPEYKNINKKKRKRGKKVKTLNKSILKNTEKKKMIYMKQKI